MIEKFVTNVDCLNCKHFNLHYIKSVSRSAVIETVWGHCCRKKSIIDLREPHRSNCKHKLVCNAEAEKEGMSQTALDLLRNMSQRLE